MAQKFSPTSNTFKYKKGAAKFVGTIQIDKIPLSGLSVFNEELKLLINDENEKFATTILDIVKNAIKSQKFKWKKLSAKYLEYKKKSGLDTRIYVATGDYLDSIGLYTIGNFYYIGPRPNGKHRSGLSYNFLARIHEFGYGNNPPRPLWRPASSMVASKWWSAKMKFNKKVKSLWKKTVIGKKSKQVHRIK